MSGVSQGARVSLVVVSHSELVAEGVADIVAQMSPDVVIGRAGGTASGGIGTDVERVMTAVRFADRGEGVIVLTDLGSAVLSAETALELLGDGAASAVRISDGPLVEGAVAAGVCAQTGGDLDEVLAASKAAAEGSPGSSAPSAGEYVRITTLVNADGLHARPAAEFVKLATSLGARVTVNGKDARSLLGILSLGLMQGATVEIATEEPDGIVAVDRLVKLVESGFSGPR